MEEKPDEVDEREREKREWMRYYARKIARCREEDRSIKYILPLLEAVMGRKLDAR